MQHRVHVQEDNDHYLAARDCHVHHPDDTITWVNHTSTDFTIHFDDSPFTENDFVVPSGGTLNSPVLKSGLEHTIVGQKVFSYELLPPAVSTAKAADPNVIVHNAGT